jgi:hypothetical protein
VVRPQSENASFPIFLTAPSTLVNFVQPLKKFGVKSSNNQARSTV